MLETVEITTRNQASAAVIWLHGLGADGHDFEPIVPWLGLESHSGVRFVFPHAPLRPVTLNGGLVMRAWYDIRETNLRLDRDEEGIRESGVLVERLIEREKERGIPGHRIVLAGFSQGGAMALHVGLRHRERLAGLLALSTYLLCDDRLETERSNANRELPIFQAHGVHDDLVPLERGKAARNILVRLGHDVSWRTYEMGHEVHPEEIEEVGAWLRKRI